MISGLSLVSITYPRINRHPPTPSHDGDDSTCHPGKDGPFSPGAVSLPDTGRNQRSVGVVWEIGVTPCSQGRVSLSDGSGCRSRRGRHIRRGSKQASTTPKQGTRKKDSDRFADSDSDSDSCFRPVYLPPHSSPLRGPGQMIL